MIASQKQLTKRLFPDYKVITKLRIARGRIVQTGTADDLVSHPANRYVANILRLSNIFHGRAVAMSDGPGLEVGGVVVPAPEAQDKAEFLIRPWDIHLADGKVTGGRAVLSGKIIAYDLAGAFARVRIDGPMPLEMVVPRREATTANLGPGKVIRVTFGRDAVHLLKNGKE
jgi:ABC-type Fe3+/spermidine/putrescine transport system ATPase subunit